SVRAFASAGDGDLWIGTGRGVAKWNPDSSAFRPLETEAPLAAANVSDLLAARDGSLWVGTRGEGLVVRQKDGALSRHRHDPANPRSIGHDHVSVLHEGKEGRIHVGTIGGGLFRFDPASSAFDRVPAEPGAVAESIAAISE